MALPVSRPARLEEENIPRGIVFMILTTLSFVLIDVCGKQLAFTLPLTQIVWGRFVFHLLAAFLFLGPRLPRYWRSERPVLQIFRSSLLLVTTYLFFAGIRDIELAMASSIMFMTPILVTALSVPLLGEKIGYRRVIGILVGIAGSLIIVRPGLGEVPLSALYFIAAAVSNSLYQITTRMLRGSDDAYTTLIYTALVGAVLATGAVPFEWQTPSLFEWAAMAAMGFFGATGHLTLIRAFQSAPPSALMPFAYTGLVWATLFGFLSFANLPDGYTLLGAAIIAGSGFYIFRREQAAARAKTPQSVV